MYFFPSTFVCAVMEKEVIKKLDVKVEWEIMKKR